MTREEARQEIRKNWEPILKEITEPAKQSVNGKRSYICPICGHGAHGDGLTTNPKSADGNGLKCFGCDFSGDIIDLLEKTTGKDYAGAVTEAAAVLHITIGAEDHPISKNEATERPQTKDTQAGKVILPIGEENPQGAPERAKSYAEYYAECKTHIEEPAAKAYLHQRGISVPTAAAAGAGYDPADRRIVIPISDSFYIARAIDPDEKLRYKNPAGASADIYNAAELYRSREDNSPIFVVEGIFDALSIQEAGGAAIALNSTSNAHKLLERLEQKPTPAPLIICMDNDTAGEKAKETLTDGLQQLNISYTIEDVSGNHKDANEAIVADRQTFKKTVGAAVAHAKRPDNTKAYIDLLMGGEIEKFRAGCNRKTGYANLDKDCNAGGLYSGLYILAAISSLGKTSFALQLADQIAAAGTDVIYFSLEQSRLELVTKSLARITAQQDIERAANSLAIRKGKVTEQVLDAAEQYKAATGDRLSIVEGNFNCTVSFIGEYVQRYVTRTGCKPVIFVDYLQILQGDPDRRQTTKEVMDTTVTQLKRMSRDLDVTVICISSVNRTNYLTPIDFESLKESGGLEFSADVVWGLQLQCLNEDLFDNAQTKIKEKRQRIRDAKAENPRKIELVCLKNRYGISSFSCYFDYYAAHDLFIPAEADNTNTHPKKAGRRL